MPLLKDAREAVDRLVEGGVSEQQANAIVDLFVDADEQVATRSDVQQLGNRIDHLSERIDEVEERLSHRIDEVEKRFDQHIDEVEDRLGQRIGEVEDRLGQHIDEVEDRLDQQMEVQEERLTRRIQQTETRLLRWTMGAFAALAGLLTIFEFVL